MEQSDRDTLWFPNNYGRQLLIKVFFLSHREINFFLKKKQPEWITLPDRPEKFERLGPRRKRLREKLGIVFHILRKNMADKDGFARKQLEKHGWCEGKH